MAAQTNWNNFPVETITTRTFLKRALIHAELLRETLRRAKQGPVLEVGVGSGAQSALLSRWVRSVTVDNDLRIIGAARPNLERFGRGVQVLAGNGFNLPFRDGSFGVAISQGLLEHFDDEHIGALVREKLRVSRSIVFNVPSDRYPRQIVGDERFMPPSAWAEIIGGAVDERRYRVHARYYRIDLEALRYSLSAGRNLGSFSVLVSVDAR